MNCWREDLSRKTDCICLCELCEEENLIPENGFQNHKRVKIVSDDYILSLESEIEEIKKIVLEIESSCHLIHSVFLYKYFENIKRRVDLRREKFKDKIDQYSDELIKKIE